MSDFPIFEPGQSETVGIGGSTSYGAALPRGTAAHSKGAWTTLFTATHNIRRLDLKFTKHVVSGTLSPIRYLVDIGLGTQVYVQNILVYFNPRSHAKLITLPIQIPAGTVVKARMQAGTHGMSGPDLYVSGIAYSQGFATSPAFQAVATYGVSTSTTSGTQIDPGGTADTKGGYTQITAATAATHRHLILCVAMDNSAATDADWRIDLAVGTGGSEIAICQDMVMRATAGSDDVSDNFIPIRMLVPAGERLSVQAQCSITGATDRLFDCSIIGFG